MNKKIHIAQLREYDFDEVSREIDDLAEKSITFFRRLGEYARLIAIFPMDAPKFFVTYVRRRIKAVVANR